MSTQAKHMVYPAWPDTMVYKDETGRELPFDVASMDEPPKVIVPSAASWLHEVPDWAAPQRELILGRLRDARCELIEK